MERIFGAGSCGLSNLSVSTFSIAMTTSMPFSTLPNTVCLPSRRGMGTVEMKNCEPLLLGLPAMLAMLTVPGRSCLSSERNSSSNSFKICQKKGGFLFFFFFFCFFTSSPQRLSSSSISFGISRLNHESSNDTVKNQPFVITILHQSGKVFISSRSERRIQTDSNVSKRSVQNTNILFFKKKKKMLFERKKKTTTTTTTLDLRTCTGSSVVVGLSLITSRELRPSSSASSSAAGGRREKR